MPRFAAARYNFERLTLDQVIERWATFFTMQLFDISMSFFEKRRCDHDWGTILSRQFEPSSNPVVPAVRQHTVDDLAAKFKPARH